jgi:hypothetical protein
VAVGPGEVWFKHATYDGPFHPQLLPVIETAARGRAAALKQSHLRHTYPRAHVEEKIARLLVARNQP